MRRASHRPAPTVTSPDGAAPRLVTLGSIALASHASPLLLGPGKPLALLTYLRATPGLTATREHLVDLLWSDREPALGRQALRQTLLRLRQALGEKAFTTAHDELTLSADVSNDRAEFLEFIARGAIDEAVETYAGSFFPGFAATGSIQFEHWVDAERAHLRGLYLRAGDTRVRRLLEDEPREALRVARALHREAPESESIWRLLLQAALAARDPLLANTEAEALERWLLESARRPDPATSTLLRIVRDASVVQEQLNGGHALVAELVGREREFADILQAWEAVARGGGARYLHLEAPAGLGKSRLLADCSHRLCSMGVPVLRVSAHQGEQEMPYSLAASTVRALAGLPGVTGVSPSMAGPLLGLHPELSVRFPAATAVPANADLLHQRTASLAELLAAVAHEQPFALFVDDLHWADAASRQALAGATHRAGVARVLLVTAARPGGSGGPLVPAATCSRLRPLTAHECEALVASLAVTPDAAWSAQIGTALWRASHGSPLLAVEALQLALERGDLEMHEGVWRAPDLDGVTARMSEGDPLSTRLASLGAAERRVLQVLAVAGRPLRLALIEATLGTGAALAPLLPGLEARGYLGQVADGWVTGHDEIADAVLREMPMGERRATAAGIGRALLTDAPGSPLQLQAAASLLEAAGDLPALAQVLRHAVTLARRRGDSRPAATLTAELLHAAVDSPEVVRLSRTLPLGLRTRVQPRRWLAATAVLAVVGTALFSAWRTAAPPPEVELLVPRNSPAGTTALAPIPLRLATWDPGLRLIPTAAPARLIATGERRYDRLALSPDGERVAFTRLTQDSGVTDIFIQEADGRLRRVTSTPGDDVLPSWSPDGRLLVFSTSRWTPVGDADADLALLDPATGHAWPLTKGPDVDRVSAWSPDGGRIAFLRTSADGGRRQLCWISQDGGSGRCRQEPGVNYIDLAGWDGPRSVFAVRTTAGQGAASLVRVDIDGVDVRVVDAHPTSAAVSSPDGRWILAVQQDLNRDRPWLRAFPSSDPGLARTVVAVGETDLLNGAVWRGRPATAPSFLDTLRITGPVAPPVIGVTHWLRTEGRTAKGGPIAVPSEILRWTVDRPDVADVDSVSGLLIPRRAGTVQATVTAGGWRSATTTLQVRPAASQPLDSVRWSAAEWDRWARFGMPEPMRKPGESGGWIMLPNGDETFESGVASVQAYAVAGGLGIEALVRLPIARPKWQQFKLSLGKGSRTEQDGVSSEAQCGLGIPLDEGSAYLDQIGFNAWSGEGRVTGSGWLRDGGWHRLRIEILPDGSCAFAADDRPLWRSPAVVAAGDSVRLLFSGHSVDAAIAVGRVDLWRGVRAPRGRPTPQSP